MVDTYVPVPEFYAGKSVFITGGAGYLGKVLVEKLLYSCPKLDKLYLLLRDKHKVSAEQRFQQISELPLFSRLKNERPQDLGKVVILKGDITASKLDMKTEDLEEVIEKVAVVIHSAATIKFNEQLKIALNTNLDGTRNVLNLCHLMKNLRAFVYISTAYSNPTETIVKEIVYPPPTSLDEAYAFAKQPDVDEQTVTKFLRGHPNTYTFTKAFAESLVSETHGEIPTVIVRPSIVSPSKDEPVKGWVDNWYGATGALTAIGKGICRVIYTRDHYILDLIPVDYVCNLTLVAAARAKRQTGVSFYNCCTSQTNPITMRRIANFYGAACVKNKFNMLPFPHLIILTKRYWLLKTITYITYLAAFVADLFARLTMNRPRFTKTVAQSIMVRDMIAFFTSYSWVMETDRARELHNSLSPQDSQMFPWLAKDICWEEYLTVYSQGVKKYLIDLKNSQLRS